MFRLLLMAPVMIAVTVLVVAMLMLMLLPTFARMPMRMLLNR